MYATFKMELPNFDGDEFNSYYRYGIDYFKTQKKEVDKSLDNYLSSNGIIEASKVENDWFPSIKADVFLSHSHKDEKQVIAFAGFLRTLGLKVFVDSCVWGNCNDLIMKIDNMCCNKIRNTDGSFTYDYESSHNSASHVYMILNGALMKMMNKTECVIFLDTPNSIKTSELPNIATDSGWIYSELLMSTYLKRIQPSRIPKMNFKSNNNRFFNMIFYHNVDISHLVPITIDDIINANEQANIKQINILDQLYLNKNIVELYVERK